jgi:hypothetical protein
LAKKTEKFNSKLIKKILIGLGLSLIIIGVIRQWPIAGKSYMEFIEGEGYLTLMLGLIMTVLGISTTLIVGQKDK